MFSSIISRQETEEHLYDKNWRIFDCSFNLFEPDQKKAEFAMAHIPNATYVHTGHVLSSLHIPGKTGRHPLPEISKIEASFSALGIDGNYQVVVYDDLGGAFAARMWWMLLWLGHEKVAVMVGGFPLWKKEIRPLTSVIQKNESAIFRAKVKPNWLAVAEDLVKAESASDICMLDARNADRYAGENEIIDPVAGHVPEAINAPFSENLDADGNWKNPAELKSRFIKLLQGKSAEKSIHYCGSGINACHNILAMFHAGLGDSRLYAGSWSDWITDSSRKIA